MCERVGIFTDESIVFSGNRFAVAGIVQSVPCRMCARFARRRATRERAVRNLPHARESPVAGRFRALTCPLSRTGNARFSTLKQTFGSPHMRRRARRRAAFGGIASRQSMIAAGGHPLPRYIPETKTACSRAARAPCHPQSSVQSCVACRLRYWPHRRAVDLMQ